MANLRSLIVLGVLILVKYGQGDETCSTGNPSLVCTDGKECCNNNTSCCTKFWSTWRIIVIAGAGVVALGLLIVLIIAAVYHVCYKKNSKNNNNVMPMQQQQAGGSGYNQPPPPYEYNINDRDAAFLHPPPLPAYSKGPLPGEKKVHVKAFNEDD